MLYEITAFALPLFLLYLVFALIQLTAALSKGADLSDDEFKQKYGIGRDTVQNCYYVVITLFCVLLVAFALLLYSWNPQLVYDAFMNKITLGVLLLFTLIVASILISTFADFKNISSTQATYIISWIVLAILVAYIVYVLFQASREIDYKKFILTDKKTKK